MVTINDYVQRTNSKGESFFVLQVQGGIEIVKSKETGRNYFTAKAASVPCTFSEEVCKTLIGQQLSGSVKKVECEPYEITHKDTGEIMQLHHRYEYLQEGETVDEVIKEDEVLQKESF